jgi:hypothetical protein
MQNFNKKEKQKIFKSEFLPYWEEWMSFVLSSTLSIVLLLYFLMCPLRVLDYWGITMGKGGMGGVLD